MNKEEFELTKKLSIEERRIVDAIEKYLLYNHIGTYCGTSRTSIKEWVLSNQNKDD